MKVPSNHKHSEQYWKAMESHATTNYTTIENHIHHHTLVTTIKFGIDTHFPRTGV
jgi:hypothetical protein